MAKKYFFQELFNVEESNDPGIMDEHRDDVLEALHDASIATEELAAAVHLFHCECIGLRRRNDELEIESICYRMARIVAASEWRK